MQPADRGGPRYRVGVDVGGTHTDIVLHDGAGGALSIVKLASTPHNPAVAVLDGLGQLFATGLRPEEVGFFGHGTTVTTNALLELKGAAVGLLVNAGMRGIAEVQTQGRDGASPFDHRFRRPEPLVRPRRVAEIGGRIDHAGNELVALDESAVREAAIALAGGGVRSFAVCFLFSFMNPAHERRAAAIVREAVPDAFVSCSSAVLPRIREWPRLSTTLLNAYLAPVLAGYCRDLAAGLDRAGVATRQRFLMQSNGGVMPLAAEAEAHAVRTLLSGPAAGVRAAAALGGGGSIVTMDMGGTSCDIAFIEDGAPLEQTETAIDGRVVGAPALDVTTISAGGGSLVRLGAAGLLEVGPRSAGADPGPACYGRGGAAPTVTDADVVRGALNPDYFLGGRRRLDRAAAVAAMDGVARPAGLGTAEAAAGVARIVDARMADAIRVQAAKKGLDLAGFTLVPFGGAGPVHAAAVAEDLGIGRVMVPRNPGAFSALGLLCSDVMHDYVRSDLRDLAALAAADAEAAFAALEAAAASELAAEGIDPGGARFLRETDLRYAGQGYELRLPAGDGARPVPGDLPARLAQAFHDRHAALHGHAAPGTAVEVVSWRLRAVAPMPAYQPGAPEPARADPQPLGGRSVMFGADTTAEATVWRRDGLAPGWRTSGPAVVEQADATTLVPPGWTARCDGGGNLVLERGR
ncbi:MAG: hydantoinase/oxoprolinase family protein [Rhodospirillaceae bacterium]